MSADNCLAILETTEGEYRIADIHMIWLGEPDHLERLMGYSEIFAASPVFTDREAAYDHAEKLDDGAFEAGHYIEYGIEPYSVEMTFAEFYSESQRRGLWRPRFGKCDLCHVVASGRKFEECFVCTSCYSIINDKVAA